MVDLGDKELHLVRGVPHKCFYTLRFSKKSHLNSRRFLVSGRSQCFVQFFWFFKAIYWFVKMFWVKANGLKNMFLGKKNTDSIFTNTIVAGIWKTTQLIVWNFSSQKIIGTDDILSMQSSIGLTFYTHTHTHTQTIFHF